MKHVPIMLLISIPLASVLMGAVMLYFALQSPVGTSQLGSAPLAQPEWPQTEDRP